MKKHLFILSLSALTLFSCGGNQAQTAAQNSKTEAAASSAVNVDDINKKISDLVKYIPDHNFDKNIKSHYTEEFYSLLKKAWDAASEDEDAEFLYYFIEGNGDCYASINGTQHECKNFKTKVDGDKVVSTFDYVHGPDEKDSHTITLKKSGNDYLIDDWDDNKKAVSEYIKSLK